MGTKAVTRKEKRQRRRWHIRKGVNGTAEVPRLAVMVSNRYLYVQAIDDAAEVTLASVTNAGKGGARTTVATASELGASIAAKLKEKGISRVVFDRGGYRFHGRVKAVADAVSEAGVAV